MILRLFMPCDENVHAFSAKILELSEQLANGNVYFGYENQLNGYGNHHFIGYITKEFSVEKI